MPHENLWGNIGDIPRFRTPKSILSEQVEVLEKHTDFKLRGEVRVFARHNEIDVEFSIVVPDLDNYQYSVLTVTQDVTSYPNTIVSHVTNEELKCPDEATFRSNLKKILSSKAMSEVLTSLLSQVEEVLPF